MKRWAVISSDEEFWQELRQASTVMLILDYDGTLAPFVPNPAEATPHDGVREVLNELAALKKCRLAFVTGRSGQELLSLLDLHETPEVWGSHGGERILPDGSDVLFDIVPASAKALKEAVRTAHEADYVGNVEVKPGCVAFHYRSLSESERDTAREWVESRWRLIADQGAVSFYKFDGGAELRSPGFSKDMAVLSLLEEVSENDMVFYLGDDVTDEDAFAAIIGRGIGVLVREMDRQSLASWVLRPPDELLMFLKRVRDTLKL